MLSDDWRWCYSEHSASTCGSKHGCFRSWWNWIELYLGRCSYGREPDRCGGREQGKFDYAKQLGATHCVDASEDNPVEVIKQANVWHLQELVF